MTMTETQRDKEKVYQLVATYRGLTRKISIVLKEFFGEEEAVEMLALLHRYQTPEVSYEVMKKGPDSLF